MDVYARFIALLSLGAMLLVLTPGRCRAEPPQVLRGPPARAFQAAFSPHGQRLGVAYDDGGFQIWDVSAAKVLVVRAVAHGGHCRSIAWEADGGAIWTTGDEGTLKRWNAESAEQLGATVSIEKPYRLVVAPVAGVLAIASRDGAIHLLPLPKPQQRGEMLRGHGGPVRDLALSPDGRRLASAGHDRVLKVWDIEARTCLQSIEAAGGGRMFAVAFSPDGEQAAMAGDGGRIHLCDIQTGKVRTDWQAHDREIRSLSFSRDGRTLASAGEDVEVRLWETAGGKLRKALPGNDSKAYCVCFSPTADVVAVGRADGSVELWRDVATR